ncbi:hypothetical protein GWK47_015204 [Chionoecetes opilio]|uniref:Uncharacterized protein n=1 Tax=Chionoecetes opilio TaxID=41210 RepID=A0A8J4Y354_CHIOP|nr:hypothetical protein GWK47_015204 [Chionoecetes opilio]
MSVVAAEDPRRWTRSSGRLDGHLSPPFTVLRMTRLFNRMQYSISTSNTTPTALRRGLAVGHEAREVRSRSRRAMTPTGHPGCLEDSGFTLLLAPRRVFVIVTHMTWLYDMPFLHMEHLCRERSEAVRCPCVGAITSPLPTGLPAFRAGQRYSDL